MDAYQIKHILLLPIDCNSTDYNLSTVLGMMFFWHYYKCDFWFLYTFCKFWDASEFLPTSAMQNLGYLILQQDFTKNIVWLQMNQLIGGKLSSLNNLIYLFKCVYISGSVLNKLITDPDNLTMHDSQSSSQHPTSRGEFFTNFIQNVLPQNLSLVITFSNQL